MSLSPPIKTVWFPILASNFPCLEIKSTKSVLVAPATSTNMKWFPVKSDTGRTLISDKPNSSNLFLVMSTKSLTSPEESFLSSAWTIALEPPAKSKPVLMFVLGISATVMFGT